MFWVRIDNRLIHGQVVEAWVPYISAHNILVGYLLEQGVEFDFRCVPNDPAPARFG